MKSAFLFGLFLAMVGCDNNSAATAPVDNSRVNERDRNTVAITSGDQDKNESDWTITRKIREGVMKNYALSSTAKNVKIITLTSVVTLRGPVKSEKERANLVAIAEATGGVKRVDNRLEIASN